MLNVLKECSKSCYETQKINKCLYSITEYSKYNIISFRGTANKIDRAYNMDCRMSPNGFHQGLEKKYESVRIQLAFELKNTNKPFVFTGYSSGSALACLAALEHKNNTDKCVTFASPPFCSKDKSEEFMKMFPDTYRCLISGDPIQQLNETWFYHIGHYVYLSKDKMEIYNYPHETFKEKLDIDTHSIYNYLFTLQELQLPSV